MSVGKLESALFGDQCSKFASASLVHSPAPTFLPQRACFNLSLLAFFLLEDLTGLALCDDLFNLLLLDPGRVHSDSGSMGFAIRSVSLLVPEGSGTTFAQMA